MKAVAACVLGLILLTGPARAGLEFCNDTGLSASVAIGYNDDGTWTSEGWWTMAPGTCATVVAGDLTKRYYYWRATNENGAFEAENYFFCVSQKAFTIAGDTECGARGYERLTFTEADTGEARDATIRLRPEMAPAGGRQSSGTQSKDGSRSTASVSQAAGSYDFAAVEANLQGLWKDYTDDAIATLISGNRLVDQFAGVSGAEAQWGLAETCDGADGAGPVMLVQYEGDGDNVLCWVLVELNDRNLKFRAIGGTGVAHMVRQQ